MSERSTTRPGTVRRLVVWLALLYGSALACWASTYVYHTYFYRPFEFEPWYDRQRLPFEIGPVAVVEWHSRHGVPDPDYKNGTPFRVVDEHGQPVPDMTVNKGSHFFYNLLQYGGVTDEDGKVVIESPKSDVAEVWIGKHKVVDRPRAVSLRVPNSRHDFKIKLKPGWRQKLEAERDADRAAFELRRKY